MSRRVWAADAPSSSMLVRLMPPRDVSTTRPILNSVAGSSAPPRCGGGAPVEQVGAKEETCGLLCVSR